MQRVRKHSIVWLAILSLQVIAINVAPPGTNAARLPDILLRGRSLISNTLLPMLRSAALHAAVPEVVALTPCDAPASQTTGPRRTRAAAARNATRRQPTSSR